LFSELLLLSLTEPWFAVCPDKNPRTLDEAALTKWLEKLQTVRAAECTM
jgi:hypothetical protein